jgi:hypothetical protein
MLAQSGVGDVPEIVLLILLSLWPQHLYCALSKGPTSKLVGYGVAAVSLQVGGLILFAILTILIFRFKKWSLPVKLFSSFVLYATIVLGTNFIPTLF